MINKKPYIDIPVDQLCCWEGWDAITQELKRAIDQLNKRKVVIVVECYQGTYETIDLKALKKGLSPNATCRARDIYRDEPEIKKMAKHELNIGSFSSRLSANVIEDYFDDKKLKGLQDNISFIDEGIVLIYGTGASKIWPADILVYADMSRWEIIQRFRRNDITNLGIDNEDENYELQCEWSYCIDWRICDKIKKEVLNSCHYILESNNWQKPKLAVGEAIRNGLELATHRPFFMAPFFDPRLWGDTEEEEEVDEADDFYWGFNCVVEDDNILFKIGECLFEVPAVNAIFYDPEGMLGEATYKKFGFEMPIRFEFIDGMENKELKLSFYPGAEILKKYNDVSLHQCESFYVMDTDKKARLCLGLKDGVSKEDFKRRLQECQSSFNKTNNLKELLDDYKIKKHDYVFLPVEQLHSYGENAMFLHISTAPKIFNYNVFDFKKRLNLDQYSPDRVDMLIGLMSLGMPKQSKKKFINNIQLTEENGTHTKERLSAEENQDINVERIWFQNDLEISSEQNIHVLTLIEGDEVIVKSKTDAFKPVIVHYTDTFILPASVPQIMISPVRSSSGNFGVIKVNAIA